MLTGTREEQVEHETETNGTASNELSLHTAYYSSPCYVVAEMGDEND